MREVFEKVLNGEEEIAMEEQKVVKFLVPVAFTVVDGKVINQETNQEDAELQSLYDMFIEKITPEPELTEDEGETTESQDNSYPNY